MTTAFTNLYFQGGLNDFMGVFNVNSETKISTTVQMQMINYVKSVFALP